MRGDCCLSRIIDHEWYRVTKHTLGFFLAFGCGIFLTSPIHPRVVASAVHTVHSLREMEEGVEAAELTVSDFA
jgi:hypothetical protein